ncbi:M23 family metallopeptidase [bacterium]|nr:M23 family metallopeptidase [bacterium]
MANWNEADHPRDEQGKFTDKGGGSSSTTKESYEERIQRRANILFPNTKEKETGNTQVNYNNVGLGNFSNENLSREDILFPTMKSIQENKILLADAVSTENSDTSKSTIPSDWIIPVDGGYISSPYGNRKSPGPGASTFHSGIDIAVPVGTPVKAIADGKIKVATGGIKGYGNAVYINHGDINGKRVESEYGHVSQFCVKVGQTVKKGQIIALSGGAKGAPGSGVSQGPHLHLTIREYDNTGAKGQHVEPNKYINRKN